MKKILLLLLVVINFHGLAQNLTDVSLYLKKNKDKNLTEVKSKSGDMFRKVGHHGPAIENQWFALRIYFNKTSAIDVYSKANPGLELPEKKWYPSKKDQINGWGADYYKVGKTVGLGGIQLWDGEKVIPLNPVSKRIARVSQNENSSTMEMLSEGVLYKGKTVDILVRVKVFDDKRAAKVEAFSQTGEAVQFVTGINYHKTTKMQKNSNYIATWESTPKMLLLKRLKLELQSFSILKIFQNKLTMGSSFCLFRNR